jgi:hypothetical protein
MAHAMHTRIAQDLQLLLDELEALQSLIMVGALALQPTRWDRRASSLHD